MKKALCTLRSLVAGGVETTALTLHRFLAASSDWQVQLALMERYGDLLPEALRLRNVVLPRTEAGTPSQREDLRFILRSGPRLAAYACRVRTLLQRIRPHVLFTHSGVEFLATARLVRRDVPWVAGVGSDVFRDISSKHPALTPLFRQALRQLYLGPDALVTASHGLGEALHQRLGIPRERIEVIPNPLDLDALQQLAADDVGWVPGEPFFLAVGRLSHVKGFDLLIRAMAALPEPVPLVLLGDGEERTALRALARDLGYERLLMPGFEPNPYRLMRQALAVVVPSRLEGFSNVTLEAMACGAPVLVTDCPHGPREIAAEGRWGRVVPTGDVGALTAALSQLLESGELRSTLARAGLERARDFAAPLIARRYLELFERISRESPDHRR